MKYAVPAALAACLGLILTTTASAQIHVDLNAPAGGDGTSWATALRSVQAGVDAAAVSGGAVWVADGTYHETVDMESSVKLYGGFTGYGDAEETLLEQRDFVANEVIIDASQDSNPTLRTPIIMFRVDRVRLDGVTLTGGWVNPQVTTIDGGGLLVDSCPEGIVIADCIIRDNSVENGLGGGIHWRQSSGYIRDTLIMGNVAGDGAGISIDDASSITINDCIIADNTALSEGGGVLSGGAQFVNCVITGNSALGGGGVQVLDGGMSEFINCIVTDNTAVDAGAIAARGDGLKVLNCTIAANTASGEVTGIAVEGPAQILSTIFTQTPGTLLSAPSTNELTLQGCLFEDAETLLVVGDVASPFVDVAALNAISGEITMNIAGDTNFVMNGPIRVIGQWDQVFLDGDRTILVDHTANFEPGALRHRLIVPNTASREQALILENTMTAVALHGDMVTVADAISVGDTYTLVDYQLTARSGALDRASLSETPLADYVGAVRPRDVVGVGQEGAGVGTDIGAYESQTPLGLSAAEFDFPTIAMGSGAATPEALDMTNSVNFWLFYGVSGIQVLGDDADGFPIVSDTGEDVLFLRETRTIEVAFDPPHAGAWAASLVLHLDRDEEPVIALPLRGMATEEPDTLVNALLGRGPLDPVRADINEDGVFDAADLITNQLL